MRRMALAIAIGLLVMAMEAQMPVSGHVFDVAAQGEDATQIRDLAERLLTYPYATSDGGPARAQLLVGRLPADFPFDFPFRRADDS